MSFSTSPTPRRSFLAPSTCQPRRLPAWSCTSPADQEMVLWILDRQRSDLGWGRVAGRSPGGGPPPEGTSRPPGGSHRGPSSAPQTSTEVPSNPTTRHVPPPCLLPDPPPGSGEQDAAPGIPGAESIAPFSSPTPPSETPLGCRARVGCWRPFPGWEFTGLLGLAPGRHL